MEVKRTEHNEFRVNFKGGKEATAYYTESNDDVIETALRTKDEALAVGWGKN